MIKTSFSHAVAHLLAENIGEGKKYQNYRMLAEAVGTSHTTFTFLTQGRIKNPNPSLLRRISKALTGDSEYLVEVYARTTLGLKNIPARKAVDKTKESDELTVLDYAFAFGQILASIHKYNSSKDSRFIEEAQDIVDDIHMKSRFGRNWTAEKAQ